MVLVLLSADQNPRELRTNQHHKDRNSLETKDKQGLVATAPPQEAPMLHIAYSRFAENGLQGEFNGFGECDPHVARRKALITRIVCWPPGP